MWVGVRTHAFSNIFGEKNTAVFFFFMLNKMLNIVKMLNMVKNIMVNMVTNDNRIISNV